MCWQGDQTELSLPNKRRKDIRLSIHTTSTRMKHSTLWECKLLRSHLTGEKPLERTFSFFIEVSAILANWVVSPTSSILFVCVCVCVCVCACVCVCVVCVCVCTAFYYGHTRHTSVHGLPIIACNWWLRGRPCVHITIAIGYCLPKHINADKMNTFAMYTNIHTTQYTMYMYRGLHFLAKLWIVLSGVEELASPLQGSHCVQTVYTVV